MLEFSVTLLITVINIVFLTFILRKILFKPVTKFMTGRTKQVQDSLEQAEKEKQNAKEVLGLYEKRLANAEADADQIIQSAHEQAKADAQRIINAGKAEAERITETARINLERERNAAMALFKVEAASLVVQAASRLLKRELAGAEQQHYAAEALDQIVQNVPSSRAVLKDKS